MSHDSSRDLRRARFVLLTTFRSSGQPVSTPVWVVQDRDHLAVLTNLDSAKVRRLRRDASITLVPCSPQGKPTPSAHPVRGRANVVTDPQAVKRVWGLVRRKYALEHAVLRVLGLLRPAWRRWDGPQAVLHLDLAPPK
ncbi:MULTISPECIES: PPOX class F420-dependent oxidoreductase [unclassified Terrabacter]|uniref:PPOX class F420-dependent oxidoreductase n=1 Tax=unclassified Terrabacter TaxID=2630222 RepID=UPI002117ADA1|nr:PPOX class F420-dependent oxidoreductase [Terrabacter sp. Ter38]